MTWTPVLDDVLMWRDSCNVYAVLGQDGAIIVDAGTGAWLESGLGDLPVPARAILLTHYFRDHSSGAAAAAEAGLSVYVPEGEAELLTDPEHFRVRQTYLRYDNIWDLAVPKARIPITGVLRDYERLTLCGIDIEVVPLPGATPTQIGLVFRSRSGQRAAFCGETIHSPGRLARLAPLQYNYDDLIGAVYVALAVETLQRRHLDVVLPSLGEPMVRDIAAAFQMLRANLVSHVAGRPTESLAISGVGLDTVEPVSSLSPRVWRSTQGRAGSHFLLGAEGGCLAMDYGYWHPTGSGLVSAGFDPILLPVTPTPERRRPLMHSLEALRARTGVSTIDAVLPTHYHDDHVCGIPLLQRMLGTECWAPITFAPLLSEPSAYRFPCIWPRPITVDRVLAADAPFYWQGIRFHLAPMSGHTRFATLIGFEVDGIRFLNVGDQHPFHTGHLHPAEWPPVAGLHPNHVYNNGAFPASYQESARWITAFRPDYILSGHGLPLATDATYFDYITEYGREFARQHTQLMALDAGSPHFGLDSMAGWIQPYRCHVAEPGQLDFLVTVRNPLPVATTLELRLEGPTDWVGSEAAVDAEAREEVSTAMSLTAKTKCRRQPVTIALRANGQHFGEVLEALVTVGAAAF